MIDQRKKFEQGQVLVILVAAIIGLLAMAALAIDGGMIFSERRDAQNAADAAALAGAYSLARVPDGSGVVNAATNRATDNGYQTDSNTTVVVNYPPVAPNPYAGNTHYVQVIITSRVNTSLVHFAYNGPVRNTVEATAHVAPGTQGTMYNGNALIALAPDMPKAFEAQGNFYAMLVAGGIFVNSSSADAVWGPSGSKEIHAPNLSVVGDITPSFFNGTVVIGETNTDVDAIPYPLTGDEIPAPDCAALGDASYDAATQTFSPGVIHGGVNFHSNHDIVTFGPGIYCIEGGMDFNGKELHGDGVMLYFTGSDTCDLTWNGDSLIDLKAAQHDELGKEYNGLVIYFDGKFKQSPQPTYPLAGLVKINGTDGSEVKGTIYAPACEVMKDGASDMEFTGQWISYDFKLAGNAHLNLIFNSDWAPEVNNPALVDLVR